MADNDDQIKNIPEVLPEPAKQWLERAATGAEPANTLDEMFPGEANAGLRADFMKKGFATYRDSLGREQFMMADVDESGKVWNIAASIPRDPGRSFDFVNTVSDFQDLLTASTNDRKDAITLFQKIARADGTSNNAINKLAALINPEGAFKVRGVRGKRGKTPENVRLETEGGLNWWKDNVNNRPDDGVITGDRGLTAFLTQGTRLLLIEGDHIARHVWTKSVQIQGLNQSWDLPMNLQTFSASTIELVDGLGGTNYEVLYWVPPSNFVQLLRDPRDKNLKKILDKVIPSKVKNELINTGRYYLDPNLLIHIKHRGTQVDAFGQSLLEPTLADIRWKVALDQLELVVITQIMARMVIIKVGSDNEKSVYHRQEVTKSRLNLLRRMISQIGPYATVLWGGPDIDVVEVGAHDALLDIVPRMEMAERRQLMSLGLPAVLMVGEGSDGKAAGYAAALGVAAQLKEIQQQYAQALRTLAELILTENGYEDVDVVWEWSNNVLEDMEAAADMIVKLFSTGLLSPETALGELGFDYDAEVVRQEAAVAAGYKDDPFGLTKGLANNPAAANPTGNGGGAGGRPPGGGRDPRERKEKKTPTENS